MYIIAPRRHSRRTLLLLLFFYAAAGAIGMAAAGVVAAGFAIIGVEATPERFVMAMIGAAPIGLAPAVILWRRHVRPRIQFDREQAFAEFEAALRTGSGRYMQ
jgi:hypothetical protein